MEKTTAEDQDLTTLLKREVERIFGRKIQTSRDCILLSEDIFTKTGSQINANTLRRLFGLVKANYRPSANTLKILVNYCGFESIENLRASLHTRTTVTHENDAAAQEFLGYIISLFRNTPVKNHSDETFMAVVKETILFLQRHPHMADALQMAIAKTKSGQDYYFEQFVNLDSLNGFYGDGLRYYLNEKKSVDGQVFGHSVLCLKGWLSNDAEAVDRHYRAVTAHRLSKSTHPFQCGRYYATQIYHADIHERSIGKILMEARAAHSGIKPVRGHYGLFPAFEYVFGFSLFLTGHYEDALTYANYALRNYQEKHSYVDIGMYNSFDLLKACSLAKLGKKDEAEKMYQQVKPSDFDLLTRKIKTIFYLSLERGLNKSNGKSLDQIKELVNETGFFRLNQFAAENLREIEG